MVSKETLQRQALALLTDISVGYVYHLTDYPF